MKALFLVFSLVGVCVSLTKAQDKHKDTKYKRFSVSKVDKSLQDSLQKIKPLSLDSFIQNEDDSVPIPNLYAKKEGTIYTMPIKKLDGKGLAPMPGTENLDKLELKFPVDSVKILRRDKK